MYVCESILSFFLQLFIKLYQFIFQLFNLSNESDEASFTDDDSCESKSKKNLHLSNIQKEVKTLKIKNKQLQDEIKALKHKTSITLENSNLVVIKHLINVLTKFETIYFCYYIVKLLFQKWKT